MRARFFTRIVGKARPHTLSRSFNFKNTVNAKNAEALMDKVLDRSHRYSIIGLESGILTGAAIGSAILVNGIIVDKANMLDILLVSGLTVISCAGTGFILGLGAGVFTTFPKITAATATAYLAAKEYSKYSSDNANDQLSKKYRP